MIRTIARWFAGPPSDGRQYRYRWWHNDEQRKTVQKWGYIAAALLTFGQNAAYHPMYSSVGGQTFVSQPDTGLKAAISGAIWPAYWSWEFFEWIKQ